MYLGFFIPKIRYKTIIVFTVLILKTIICKFRKGKRKWNKEMNLSSIVLTSSVYHYAGDEKVDAYGEI